MFKHSSRVSAVLPRPRLVLAAFALAACALAAASPARAAPAATELLYERTLMMTADARCRLFTPPIGSALAAAADQARGAALRAGTAETAVAAAQDRARAKALATPCASRDLATAAARVRTAFQAYAELSRMSFPGRFADWRGDRGAAVASPSTPPRRGPVWRLVQIAAQGVRPTLVGLSTGPAGAADGDVFTVVGARPQALAASTVRLVMRDPRLDASPYLDPRGRGLAARLPPRDRDRVILAATRAAAPRTLLPSEASGGGAFAFPPGAAPALAALDARDAVAVEFVYPGLAVGRGGERVETAWIEVGDFAAGLAFLKAGRSAAPRP